MMLLPASFYSAAIVILSWISSSLNQPSVKRAAAIGLINVSPFREYTLLPFSSDVG